MTKFHFKKLFNGSGWQQDKIVSVNEAGEIISIENGTFGDHYFDIAVPGFQNAHSHAFQYAMAGLAELHSTAQAPDDFWSWREAMYALALEISPDHLQDIARMLYSEMLRHGYTDVAEFHYVHHQQDGSQYAHLSEMGERLIAAAKEVGIGITLIPIFYQKGGFGKAPNAGQKRFISATKEEYALLLEASTQSCNHYTHANAAIGIHSMRGVEPKIIAEVANEFDANLPFHIHISEQLKEVSDALDYLGCRPVEWMLENVNMSDRFHLVHATHLTDQEVSGTAKSGANVVLCPTTEGNLGDGLFPLRKFQEAGGKWSIGTDSHVSLNPLEEMRLLDYGQRLISHKRNTFYSSNEGNSSHYAFHQQLMAGRKAMNNFNETYFKVGEVFDAAIYSMKHPLIATTSDANLLNTILYSSDERIAVATISKGKIVVENGKHILEDEIFQKFQTTIQDLKNRE